MKISKRSIETDDIKIKITLTITIRESCEVELFFMQNRDHPNEDWHEPYITLEHSSYGLNSLNEINTLMKATDILKIAMYKELNTIKEELDNVKIK